MNGPDEAYNTLYSCYVVLDEKETDVDFVS